MVYESLYHVPQIWLAYAKFSWAFLLVLHISFPYFGGVIPLALVGYEMIKANSALGASTRARGISGPPVGRPPTGALRGLSWHLKFVIVYARLSVSTVFFNSRNREYRSFSLLGETRRLPFSRIDLATAHK